MSCFYSHSHIQTINLIHASSASRKHYIVDSTNINISFCVCACACACACVCFSGPMQLGRVPCERAALPPHSEYDCGPGKMENCL